MYLGVGNGAILKSTDQGNTWTVHPIPVAMGGNANGRGMGERLAIDPNDNHIIYFGSRNDGLLKSTDAGANWKQVSNFPVKGDPTYGLPVILFDKQGGTVAGSSAVYVAAASKGPGTNLYRSTDGGTHWMEIPEPKTISGNRRWASPGGPVSLMVHHAGLASDGNLWLA